VGLIVHDEDDDDVRYVLVTGEPPTLEVHAWMTVREARAEVRTIGEG